MKMFLKTFQNLVLRHKNAVILVQNRLCSATSLESTTPNPILANDNYDTRLLKVAIVGTPNAGKSTFINNLMDRKVCPSSSKVHTTRKKSMAIFTEGNSQIVFIDTPGLVSIEEQKRYNLEKSFLRDSKSSLQEADVIGVIHDVSNVHTKDKLNLKVIHLLESHQDTPSVLILNKVDVLKTKRKLLDLTRVLTSSCLEGKPFSEVSSSNKIKPGEKNIIGWPYFQEIFMVSALTGVGLDDVRNYLASKAKPGRWIFPKNVWTDQTPETIVTTSVKAKLLDYLPQEIPYKLKTKMEYFDIDEEGIIKTVVLVDCPSEKTAKLVAGGSDGKLKQITQSVQEDLQHTFQNYVRIKIVLKHPQMK